MKTGHQIGVPEILLEVSENRNTDPFHVQIGNGFSCALQTYLPKHTSEPEPGVTLWGLVNPHQEVGLTSEDDKKPKTDHVTCSRQNCHYPGSRMR